MRKVERNFRNKAAGRARADVAAYRPAETEATASVEATPAVEAPPEAQPVADAVAETAPEVALEEVAAAPVAVEAVSVPAAATATEEVSPVVAEPAPAIRARPRKNRVAAVATNKVAPVRAKKPASINTSATRPAPVKSSAAQKETIKMATKTKTPEFAAAFQGTFKDAGEKARAAFEKSQAVFGDAGEFAKGNLEAVVESSKILANGVKSMSETYVSEGRSAYETMTADFKELVAVKSPAQFFELQSKLFRKNFDAAVAKGSKKSEEALKLANEAFQPISTRLSLAMEKIKSAA